MSNEQYDTAAKKMSTARSRLLLTEPFYGFLVMNIDRCFPTKESTPTMMVSMNGATIDLHYNVDFVCQLSIEDLCCIIKHELLHIGQGHLWLVPPDIKAEDRAAFDTACEFACNGKRTASKIEVCGHTPENAIYVPKDMSDSLSAIEYYDLLKNNTKKYRAYVYGQGEEGEDDNGDGENDDSVGDKKSKGKPGKGNKNNKKGGPKRIDDHSLWGKNGNPELSKARVVQMIEQAIKAIGNTPGDWKEYLNNLKKSQIPWQAILRTLLGKYLGNYRSNWHRQNRKIQQFGTKGKTKNNAAKLSVIMDVSGSISLDGVEQFFSEIEKILYKASINITTWDCALQDFIPTYRRGMWKKIAIKGRGGTGNFNKAVTWLQEHRVLGDTIIFMSDFVMHKKDVIDKAPVPVIYVLLRGSSVKIIDKERAQKEDFM